MLISRIVLEVFSTELNIEAFMIDVCSLASFLLGNPSRGPYDFIWLLLRVQREPDLHWGLS